MQSARLRHTTRLHQRRSARFERPTYQSVAQAPTPSIPNESNSREERYAILRAVPAFATLPPATIGALAAVLTEESFAPGEVIVTEGAVGDRAYLLASGRVEVSVSTSLGVAPLALLTTGELFGEIALLQPDRLRTATVTALTEVRILYVMAADFYDLLERYPAARDTFESAADSMLIIAFLKQASPFAPLRADDIERLAARLEPVHVEAGEDIVRQGEIGDRCYLLRTGQAEVLLTTADGETRLLSARSAGDIVGETALLTDSPRNATVRATEPCDLLALGRADLQEVVDSDRDLALGMIEIVQLRDQPRQTPGVLAVQRPLSDGTVITTLKDPVRAAYYRLSPEGFYIWQQLDGDHTVKDIALGYLMTFKAFAPQAIADTIAGLAASGFVETRTVKSRARDAIAQPSRWERMTALARGIMEWETSIPQPDSVLTRLYGGVRWLYTLPAQLVLALLFLSGLTIFATHLDQARHAQVTGAWILLSLLLTYGVTVLIHELGHAFTVKAFGHEVPRAGVGWYWFGPIAYIDTSDMWLAARWPRIAVTLGGLYASALVASTAAISAVLLGPSVLAAVLWQLAFFSFYLTLINLNPLMELDGYFLLMDWLERPNLRRTCLAWLGTDLPRSLRDRRQIATHRLELLYGLGAVLYILFSSYLMLGVYRPVIQGWLRAILPLTVAAVLAWLLTGALVLLALLTLAGDIRGAQRARR